MKYLDKSSLRYIYKPSNGTFQITLAKKPSYKVLENSRDMTKWPTPRDIYIQMSSFFQKLPWNLFVIGCRFYVSIRAQRSILGHDLWTYVPVSIVCYVALIRALNELVSEQLKRTLNGFVYELLINIQASNISSYVHMLNKF